MQSIWHKDVKLPQFPTLQGDIKTDVLIIGGGIAGILTAFFLKQRGIPYILVEGETICSGTTQNTTAKITAQHGLIYHHLAHIGGTELARMYEEVNQAAIHCYADLCQTFPCHFERKNHLVYSCDNLRVLEEEMQVLERAGIAASFVAEPNLPFLTAGGVEFKNQAQFQPLQFLSQIAEECSIYEHTVVQEIQGNQALTEQGIITAEQIVVTTHFPFLNRYGAYYLKLYQHRSYVLALEHAPELNGMYLDENPKGLSLRNYKNLLLLGGGSHRTGKKGGGWPELRDKAAIYFPGAKEVCHWAAQDCMSLDGIPYIGNYSSRAACLLVASGFHKWGMTGAMTAAMLLADQVSGQRNPYAELFRPQRSILHPQLFRNGFVATSNLLRFAPKRCTHMGCALHWNAAEHSWDCACHGSRFAEDGSVQNNPAKNDLEKP